MKYFKHDSDAAQDAKLRRLRLKYGMEGYGTYWFILELIARNVDKHNLTFELEHDAELIAADTGIHHERVEEMMRYMVDLGLFTNVNGIIRCLKMASRADEYTQKLMLSARPKPSIPTLSRQSPDTTETKSELREENRREENRTEQKESGRRFTPPTLPELSEFISAENLTVDPDAFFNHYESNGWHVGRTKMRNWRAAARRWSSQEKSNAANRPRGNPSQDRSVAGRIRANVARELAASAPTDRPALATDGFDVRAQVVERVRGGRGP